MIAGLPDAEEDRHHAALPDARLAHEGRQLARGEPMYIYIYVYMCRHIDV